MNRTLSHHPGLRSASAFALIGLSAVAVALLIRYVVILRFPVFREGKWYGLVDEFRLAHLLVSYVEHGYLRRGLVGTWLHLAGVEDIAFAGWVISVTSLIVFMGVIGWAAARARPDRQAIFAVVMAVMILGPAGVVQFVSDVARLDHLLIVLALLAAIAGVHGRLWLSALLFALMIPIHELSIVAFAPLLVACNTMGAADRVDLRLGAARLPFSARSALAFAGISLAAAGLTLAFGDSPAAVQALSVLEGEFGFYGDILWGDSSPIHRITWHGMPSVLLLLYWAALIAWGANYARGLGGGWWIVPAAALSGLALNLVGIDAGRWAAMSTWILIIAIVATESAQRSAPQDPPSRSFAVTGGLLALPLGPLGVITPFNFLVTLVATANG